MSRAGQPAQPQDLINLEQTLQAYYNFIPDVNNPQEAVSFGTSGHRGAAIKRTFNEAHIVAITAAIIEYRRNNNITGPVFVGFDTHYLSLPAFKTVVEVLGASDTKFQIDSHVTTGLFDQAISGNAPVGCAIWTPTPAVSRAILEYNHGRTTELADGIIITPSHNPPEGGGIKYNPPEGGPANSQTTDWIANRANEILKTGFTLIPRIEFGAGLNKTIKFDYRAHYISALKSMIDFDAIREANLHALVEPLGGSSVDYWTEIAKVYDLNLSVVEKVDPTFSFMTLDHDEKIRMDCSSPNSMAGVLARANGTNYNIIISNDADADRHGIVAFNQNSQQFVLLNPNHYLAVAISYLFGGARPSWNPSVGIGKTLVSSSLIDRVAAGLNRILIEVPVGFKWFVDGLVSGTIGFGGEESAGASFLQMDGSVWTTDKDGIIMGLLALEMTAKLGKNPVAIHQELVDTYGQSWYKRIDAPATPEQKAKLKNLSSEQVTSNTLAGEEITAKLVAAPGNGAPIGGLKVATKNAWFAARPSGTEDIYKIYAESFISKEHLEQVLIDAQSLVNQVLFQ